ncbi:MAG: ribosome maturation factor RimM [Acidimicrobiales bacterium]
MTKRLEVGRVAKSHGLRGDVLIKFTTDRLAERTAVGSRLGIGDADYVVTSAKPYQQQWLVHLDGVDRREQADLLRSKLVVADPLDDADALFVHELIGRKVVDQHGTDHGEVVSVVANPASDLLELADGRLVPMVFVLSTSDGLISVEVPAGLLDGDD